MLADTLQIKIQQVKKSRLTETDFDNLGFGKIFSDHMFVADYRNGQWTDAKIVPFENISFSPASSMMHYGQAIFEGMKAFKMENGQVGLYRAQAHYSRLNRSAERMAMPHIPEELFMEGMFRLLKMDQEWVPKAEGSSLYIRPLYIATDECIGVKVSDSYRLIIMTSPVGPYYAKPVKVLVETNYIRAVEGGVGYVKVSGNYGRSLYPTRLAQQKGYDQIIWTDARYHKYVEESGTMNLMFVINDTLVTPPLGDTILAGVTRDSVLAIAREWKMKVEERKISIDEIIEALKNGSLREAFGVGTAATVAHIALLGFEGKDYPLPAIEPGHFSKRVGQELENIKRGRSRDTFQWMQAI